MKTKTILLIAVIAATIFFNFKADAKIRRVNNQAIFGADYTNLQTCIDASNSGDTIHVEASGTGYGIISINIPLVIIGPGYFLDENPGLQKNPTPATINRITLNPGSAGTLITGVRVADDGYSKIYINADNITLERCYIEDGVEFQNTGTSSLNKITIKQCYSAGITVPGYPGPVNNLVIANCYWGGGVNLSTSTVGYVNNYQGTVSNCVFNSTVDNWSTNMIFQNNIQKAGTFNQNNNSVTNIKYNLFIAASLPTWLNTTGNTNVFKSTGVFITATGSTDYDLHVKAKGQCAECYQGYPTDTEMGLYGGNDIYKLSGLPSVPSIYLLNSPTQTIQGGTINVNISTRSNN